MITGDLKIKLFIFLVLELAFGLVAGWIFNSVRGLEKSVVEAKAVVYKMEEKIADYDRLKEEHAKLEGEGKRLFKHFASQESPVDFIARIEKAAEETNVDLKLEIYEPKAKTKKKAKSEPKAKEAPALSLMLKTESDFADWMQFLLKVENLDSYSAVEKINLRFGKSELASAPTTQEGEEATVKTRLLGETIINAY